MKKVLLGTTALAVAGGFAMGEANAAEVKISGWMNQYFYFADADEKTGDGHTAAADTGEANEGPVRHLPGRRNRVRRQPEAG